MAVLRFTAALAVAPGSRVEEIYTDVLLEGRSGMKSALEGGPGYDENLKLG